MKRTLLVVDMTPEFKQHLADQAVKRGVTVSKLVRKALEKVTKYKEKAIV